MALTERQAADRLKRMYKTACSGEKTTQIHLFGIKHAEDIADLSVEAIVKLAGLHGSYVTEVHKGIRLARYVALKRGV